MLKIAEPLDPEYENGRIISARFELSSDEYTLVPKKKPKRKEMTEEQRQKVGERLAKSRNKQD